MSLRSWVYFGVLCIAWGIPYYLIKVALLDVSPGGIAFGRVALGSLVLCAIVPPSHWRRIVRLLPALAFVGLVDLALPFYLISTGERWSAPPSPGCSLLRCPSSWRCFRLRSIAAST